MFFHTEKSHLDPFHYITRIVFEKGLIQEKIADRI